MTGVCGECSGRLPASHVRPKTHLSATQLIRCLEDSAGSSASPCWLSNRTKCGHWIEQLNSPRWVRVPLGMQAQGVSPLRRRQGKRERVVCLGSRQCRSLRRRDDGHPAARTLFDVRIVRPSALAEIPVGLLRWCRRLLDILSGRLLDHQGRGVIVGVGSSPPPAQAPNENLRATVPIRVRASPAVSPPGISPTMVPAATPPGGAAAVPSTGASPRVGGKRGAGQQQHRHHQRPCDPFHVRSPFAQPDRHTAGHVILIALSVEYTPVWLTTLRVFGSLASPPMIG